MPLVKFTKNLQRFFPDIETINVTEGSVGEVVAGGYSTRKKAASSA